jgi:hypothetical protein
MAEEAQAAALRAYSLLTASSADGSIRVQPAEILPDGDGRQSLAFIVQILFESPHSEEDEHHQSMSMSSNIHSNISGSATSDDEKMFLEDLRVWTLNNNGSEPAVTVMMMLPLGGDPPLSTSSSSLSSSSSSTMLPLVSSSLSSPSSSSSTPNGVFPLRPPEVRLLRPILKPGTSPNSGGGVVNGFFAGIPQLLPAGWSPSTSLPMVIRLIRECLISNKARVVVDTNAFYNIQAYNSARRMALSTPRYSLRHKCNFRREVNFSRAGGSSGRSLTGSSSNGGLIIFSATFAEFHLQFPISGSEHFEYGNKVLLSESALEVLLRSEIGRDGDASSSSSGSFGIVGRQASASSESAMVFELLSPLGFPVYVGVAQFTSPEPNIIIAPQQIMNALRVREGTEITVTRVNLPSATSLVLQPHSSNFDAVEDLTGKPPREFLEDSLIAYSCLQVGSVILCGGGVGIAGKPELFFSNDGKASLGEAPDTAFRFNVVSCEPTDSGNGAVALFAGFQSQVSINFLPPSDAFVHAPPAPRLIKPPHDRDGMGESSAKKIHTEFDNLDAMDGSGGGGRGGSSSSSSSFNQASVAHDPAAAFNFGSMIPSDFEAPSSSFSSLIAPSGSVGQTLRGHQPPQDAIINGGVGAGESGVGGGQSGGGGGTGDANLRALAAEREERRKKMAEAAAKRVSSNNP